MSEGDRLRYLTKSDFTRGLECAKKLWLNVHQPYLAKPQGQADRDRKQTGIQIGRLAHQLYPNGVYVRTAETAEERADATQKLIDQGAECLFEATFMDGKRLVRVDVLRQTAEKGMGIRRSQILDREGPQKASKGRKGA